MARRKPRPDPRCPACGCSVESDPERCPVVRANPQATCYYTAHAGGASAPASSASSPSAGEAPARGGSYEIKDEIVEHGASPPPPSKAQKAKRKAAPKRGNWPKK